VSTPPTADTSKRRRSRPSSGPASASPRLSSIRDEAANTTCPWSEIVVSGMFVSPDAIASVAAETVPQATSPSRCRFDQVHAVAGLIQPGDKGRQSCLDINGNQLRTTLYPAGPVLAVGTHGLVPARAPPRSGTQTTASTTSNVITFRRHTRRGGAHRAWPTATVVA